MARVNRRDVLAEGEVQVVHCVNRCVRRGFLCGDDPLTGKNYDHRRQWIRNRLEFLAGVFGVEVLSFAVMSNHFHVVLKTRPDAVADWTDEEVARRWWRLFPQRRNKDGSAADPTEFELRSLHGDKTKLAELRKRLSSVSWFMRCTSEVIARLANAQLYKPGQDKPGQDKPGQDKPGQDKPGQDKPGQDKPGQDKPGQDKPGQDKPGQDKPGQDKPGQDKPGQDKPGQDKPGQDKPGPSTLQAVLDCYNSDLSTFLECSGKVLCDGSSESA